jgi:hypothetical protein
VKDLMHPLAAPALSEVYSRYKCSGLRGWTAAFPFRSSLRAPSLIVICLIGNGRPKLPECVIIGIGGRSLLRPSLKGFALSSSV